MKNHGLATLFLAFVLVFSSTAAFAEHSVGSLQNTLFLTKLLIKTAEDVQDERNRSKENLKNASKALEALSQYPYQYVAKTFIQSMEYELMRAHKPHLHIMIAALESFLHVMEHMKDKDSFTRDILSQRREHKYTRLNSYTLNAALKIGHDFERTEYFTVSHYLTALIYYHPFMTQSIEHPKFPRLINLIQKIKKQMEIEIKMKKSSMCKGLFL